MADYCGGKGGKWFENYLPFVAKSPVIQAQWLSVHLTRMMCSEGREISGVLSRDEIKPYIRLFLENCDIEHGERDEKFAADTRVAALFDVIGEKNLLLLIECADIYDIPKLLKHMTCITKEQTIIALKKVPPLYEKNSLLIIDRVFQAIREKSIEQLEAGAAVVLASKDAPGDFANNYARFKEIMMDEHLLGILYPKAR